MNHVGGGDWSYVLQRLGDLAAFERSVMVELLVFLWQRPLTDAEWHRVARTCDHLQAIRRESSEALFGYGAALAPTPADALTEATHAQLRRSLDALIVRVQRATITATAMRACLDVDVRIHPRREGDDDDE